MLKILVIYTLLIGILPINGQQESQQAGSDKVDAANNTKPPTPDTQEAKCVIEQNGATIQCTWPKDEPKTYLQRLSAPENAPNIALFFVGLGGVVAALLTLRVINRQAREATLQRIATHNTLTAIKRQANIMEAQASDARNAAVSQALDTKATIEALTLQAKALDEQAKNTASQIKLMEEQIKIGVQKEKALLSLTDIQLDIEDGFPIVRYWIINHGTTPAFVKNSWYVCEVLPIDDLEWPQEQIGNAIRDLPEVVSTVPRFMGKIFVWHIGAFKTWEEAENAIKTGKLWLLFRVKIVYRHIFDEASEETLIVSKVYGVDSQWIDHFTLYPEWRNSKYSYGQTDQQNPN